MMLMKRKALTVILSIIIVFSVIILLIYHISELQGKLNELEKQIEMAKSVKIVDFSSPGWWNPVGVWIMVDFNITIINNCTYEVEDVIIEIRRLDFEEDLNNITHSIGVLSAREIISIQDTLHSGFNAFAEGSQCLIAFLKVGNEIVDNRVIHVERT